ncbi:MAG: GTP cyclohydrolase II RibA [Alphaproteobacteria bacterium]|jgi:GTP cyclohydrolase II
MIKPLSTSDSPVESESVDLRAVDRAAVALRRGDMALLTSGGGDSLVLAAEGVTSAALARLARLSAGETMLVLTAPRAAALKLLAASGPVIVAPLDETVDAEALRSLTDPAAPLDDSLYTALTHARGEAKPSDRAAIALAKRAHLLPAAISAPVSAAVAQQLAASGDLAAVAAAHVIDYERSAAASLRPVSETRLDLADAEDSRLITFRPANGGSEHLAIIIGDPGAASGVDCQPPLTRLHSECFTGDLLGSLRCDCGDQLRGAIRAMAAEGCGVLLYLAQEGRGIGLVNKLRAYNLQDAGFDTLDANIQLGFDADERLYLPAAEMLRQLGHHTVRLMTNNPDKVFGLERNGVTVAERVPLVAPASGYNDAYLATKAKRFGHIL